MQSIVRLLTGGSHRLQAQMRRLARRPSGKRALTARTCYSHN